MPGTLVSLAVKEGDEVFEGQEIAIVEAMKMQNRLVAPRVGKIKKVFVQVRTWHSKGYMRLRVNGTPPLAALVCSRAPRWTTSR
jgi:acetyl/propionyl-CoA carboxylase alpha subunit